MALWNAQKLARLMWESFVMVANCELGMDFSQLDVPVDPLKVVRMIKYQLGNVGILIHLDQAQDLRRHAGGWFKHHQSAFADITPIKNLPTDTDKQKLARQQSQAELAGVYGIWEVITPCLHDAFVNAILTGRGHGPYLIAWNYQDQLAHSFGQTHALTLTAMSIKGTAQVLLQTPCANERSTMLVEAFGFDRAAIDAHMQTEAAGQEMRDEWTPDSYTMVLLFTTTRHAEAQQPVGWPQFVMLCRLLQWISAGVPAYLRKAMAAALEEAGSWAIMDLGQMRRQFTNRHGRIAQAIAALPRAANAWALQHELDPQEVRQVFLEGLLGVEVHLQSKSDLAAAVVRAGIYTMGPDKGPNPHMPVFNISTYHVPGINDKARKLDLSAGRLPKKLMRDPWCKMLPILAKGVQIRLLLAADAALGCPSPTSAGPDLLLRAGLQRHRLLTTLQVKFRKHGITMGMPGVAMEAQRTAKQAVNWRKEEPYSAVLLVYLLLGTGTAELEAARGEIMQPGTKLTTHKKVPAALHVIIPTQAQVDQLLGAEDAASLRQLDRAASHRRMNDVYSKVARQLFRSAVIPN
ncbi:hypothetical protein WJX72_006552 [[Myrmecia] bisecta]|uniref:Uncharacterized protein n=1 Tax=[Myrmecia] bisecta TaxID=41462 RepID=A0AAW1PC00_9CHLO